MAEQLIQLIVDDEENTVRFSHTFLCSNSSLALIAVAAMHAIAERSQVEQDRERARRVLDALGAYQIVEKDAPISSN